jgi:ribosomal protein S18 acetylase RimI-like enzyme
VSRLVFSADRRRVDLKTVHAYLSERSYWAKGRTRAAQRKANDASFVCGLYDGRRQAAFARVITDYVTFAYLCDVFVMEEYRGRGLGKRLMRELLRRPEFKTVKRWTLYTKDAQGLYRMSGFVHLKDGKRFMERLSIARR